MDKTGSTQQKQGSIAILGQRPLERPRRRWVNNNVMRQNDGSSFRM
jgi:hypothetical protein